MSVIKEYRGIRDLVYAKLTADTALALTYGTVKKLAGVATLKKTVETSSDTKHYDNTPSIVTDAEGPDTVECETSVIEEEELADITGQFYDSDLQTLVEGNSDKPYLAIGYITRDTQGKERWVWRLKTKASTPDEEHKTVDNSTDSNGQTITFTGISTEHKLTKTGKTAKSTIYNPEKGLFTESEFFATVQTIDTIQAKADAE